MDESAALTQETCLIEGCRNPARFRGLCRRCHTSARRAIAAKEITEEQLVGQGLLLPAARGCRKTKTPWQIQFDRIKREGQP